MTATRIRAPVPGFVASAILVPRGRGGRGGGLGQRLRGRATPDPDATGERDRHHGSGHRHHHRRAPMTPPGVLVADLPQRPLQEQIGVLRRAVQQHLVRYARERRGPLLERLDLVAALRAGGQMLVDLPLLVRGQRLQQVSGDVGVAARRVGVVRRVHDADRSVWAGPAAWASRRARSA
jgi:hypothetical protein